MKEQKPADILSPDGSGPGGEISFPPGEVKRLEKRRWILEHAPKGAIGAEIGVFRGHFSVVLCEMLRPKKLYLVDPWTKLGETFGWGDENAYTSFDRLTTEYAKRDAATRVGSFTDIDIRLVEEYAETFLSSLTGKLDWVYLDATHKYEATLGELKLIDAVLAPHGVILGDDWQPARQHKDHGVYRAIHDFIRTHPYEIVAAGPAAQWCLRRTPKIPLVVEKFRVAGVCHMTLENFNHPIEPGDPFDIGGVVVMEKAPARNSALRLINARDGQEAAKVEWGIPSPGMARKYPDAGNGTISRFACRGIRIHPGDRLELHHEGGDGKRQRLWSLSTVENRNS